MGLFFYCYYSLLELFEDYNWVFITILPAHVGINNSLLFTLGRKDLSFRSNAYCFSQYCTLRQNCVEMEK